MKAKYEQRSPIADRVNLASVIPLVSPLTIVAEVASVCNLRCHFCPTGDRVLTRSTGKFRGLMERDLFRLLIANIDTLPVPIKALHLHKDGEPLLHPEFCDMVRWARRSPNIEKIETTTNGVPLCPELNRRLVDSGIDRIKVSVYGMSSESFKSTTGMPVDFAQYVANVADLYARRGRVKVYVKMIAEGMTKTERALFLSTFGDISDTIFFEHCGDTWPDFAVHGNTAESGTGIMGQHTRPYKKVCPQPFFNLTVCADGRVTACCADWQVKLVVGDLRESTLLDIWNGEQLNDFRLMMLRGERANHPVCGKCNYPTFACVDDIDDDAGRLLTKVISHESVG